MAYHEFRTYKPGFPITSRRFEDFIFHPHWHYEYEILLVLAGSIRVTINSVSKVLFRGDIAFISCEDIHHYSDASAGSEVLIIVFHPDLLSDTLGDALSSSSIASFLDSEFIHEHEIPQAEIQELARLLTQIDLEMQEQRNSYKIFVKSDVLKIVALLLRHADLKNAHAAKSSVDKSSIKIVKDALHYIELNYMQDITLGDISSHLSFSPFYFSRIFNQVTGVTFKNYLNIVRVEKAQNLICTTSRPILDIALDCGFNSIRTFNRVFHNIKGYTPNRLRQDDNPAAEIESEIDPQT